MARQVFLHIGVPKSGTTFLQTRMWHNRPQLQAQGILYPGAKRLDHYHASQVVRDADPERLGSDADSWDRLVAELSGWPEVGLISHEFFCMATTDQIRRAVAALAPAQVDVVVTARDYVRQFPAVWQEALKMNSDIGLDEFMDAALAHQLTGAWSWRSQNLTPILRRWATVVPPARIHLITVPPRGAPKELLWERWCEVLGVDDRDFNIDLAYHNESLGAAQAALMVRVKPHLEGPLNDGPERHRWVRKYFGHQVLVPQRGQRFGLRPRHEEALQRMSRAMSRKILKDGYDVVGDLADLMPAEPGTTVLPHPDDVPDDQVLESAARAIARMIADVRAVTLERDDLRGRLETRAEKAEASSARGRARRVVRRITRRGAR